MSRRSSVLLVGDVIDEAPPPSAATRFEQDMPTLKEVAALAEWLERAGYDVEVERSVSSFLSAREGQPPDIVFPLWRAGVSRNRTAIVPAVCEARGLPYIGGDALVQSVCQDKSLSKALVRSAGMKAPKEVVVRSIDDLAAFRPASTLTSPFVVKPLYSACSIGVDDSSICVSDEQALAKAHALFESGLGPVICEDFVKGDEASLCFLEYHGRIVEKCVAVYRDDTGRCPFREGLLTFDAKTRAKPLWNIADDSGSVDPAVWDGAELMLSSLGTVDLFRIDGRLNNGEFTVIELTPDIHLGLESPFLGGFNATGKDPGSILDHLVRLSLSHSRLEQ